MATFKELKYLEQALCSDFGRDLLTQKYNARTFQNYRKKLGNECVEQAS